jgi:CBS domain-containing protein
VRVAYKGLRSSFPSADDALSRLFLGCAETAGINAERGEEVLAAARELWGAQITEAFGARATRACIASCAMHLFPLLTLLRSPGADADALALDWEVVGATARDESGTWGVRGLPAPTSQSLLAIIRDGFLAPPRAAAFLSGAAASSAHLAARPPGAPGGAGAHRIAVWTHDDARRGGEAVLLNIFSQSDAVRWLARAPLAAEGTTRADADVATLLSTPVSTLGLGATSEVGDGGAVVPRPVLTIAADAPVLAALRTMADAGVSALGVVDANGALLANFSASDVRSIMPAHLSVLSLPVAAFLEGLGRMQYYTYSGLSAKDINREALTQAYRRYEHFRMLRGRAPRALRRALADESDTLEGWAGVGVHPVGTLADGGAAPARFAAAVRPDAPLRDALRGMVRAGHHRVYTVDVEDKPLGVITLTDVLRLVGSDTTLDWLMARAEPGAGKPEFHWRRVEKEQGRASPPPPPPPPPPEQQREA